MTPRFAHVSFAILCVVGMAFSGCSPAYKLSPDRGRAEHVVLVVCDGLRPDLVTEEDMPTLWRLAREGVTFANHHPVYPCTTEVNGATIATGGFGARNRIIGNQEFRPAIDPRKPVGTENLETIRKSDAAGLGKYLGLPTVAELVQQAGFRTAVAGTKPVALLHDRAETRVSKAAKASVTVFRGKSVPSSALEGIQRAQGVFPEMISIPNSRQDLWTTKVFSEELWKDDVPRFSVLWLSDPDYSQHFSAPGAPVARDALKSCDANIAALLGALGAKGVREKTDILIVSDHGFSTISDVVDVAQELSDAGLRVVRQFSTPPRAGDILVMNTGASLFFYVTEHDVATTRRLVDLLQRASFSGVIFTREAMEGTFALSTVRIDSPDAPDVVLSLRWTDEKNEFGVAGMLQMDYGRKLRTGMHGTLSPYDMHNTLIAAGPDFPKGTIERLPTGNIDIAPTILWILGVRPTEPLDGRVLAGTQGAPGRLPAPAETILKANRELGGGTWHQYLRQVQYGGVTYFLEGNGGPAR